MFPLRNEPGAQKRWLAARDAVRPRPLGRLAHLLRAHFARAVDGAMLLVRRAERADRRWASLLLPGMKSSGSMRPKGRPPLVIHKFGGTSLGSAERIAAAARILGQAGRAERVVAVVSATAGTTNLLLAAAREARAGGRAWIASLWKIHDLHMALARHFEAHATIEVPSFLVEAHARSAAARARSWRAEHADFPAGGRPDARPREQREGSAALRSGSSAFTAHPPLLDFSLFDPALGPPRRSGSRGSAAGAQRGLERTRIDGTGLEILNLVWGELGKILQGISLLREASDRSLDAVASFGERLAAPLVAAALRGAGIPAVAVDARGMIRTDERHGRATADLGASARAIRRILARPLARGVLPVVTGFIASGPQGETTTLGRSGSDTTAAILGAALGARRIVIWTDVDGIHSADPRLVKKTRLLPRLTYREAAELTYFGAKVLHFPAMIPAISAQIPIVIKNSFRPRAPGTLIDAGGSGRDTGIAAVTAVRGLATVSLEGKGMVGVPGIAARAFSAVAREKVSVMMFSQASSEQNICMVVPEEDRARSLRALRDEFAAEIALGKLDGVRVHGPVAAVAAVGEGMRGTPGIAARLFSAVASARINVEAIAQGSSEVNISFIVEDRDAAAAVAAVHRLCLTRGRRGKRA